MISGKFLYDRISDYAAKYQSGLDIVTNFNTRLAEVQLEVFTELNPLYQANEKVRQLLQTFVKDIVSSTTNGTYTIPNTNGTFSRVLAAEVVDGTDHVTGIFEIYPITEGELVIAKRLPQRRPNYANKNVYYLINNESDVTFVPIQNPMWFRLYYLIQPPEAKIAFTYSTVNDEDIMTFDSVNSIDLAWTAEATNIILYKMLEKYGISTREAWLEQYALLGIKQLAGGNQ